jgi:cardiolipin synthase
MTEHIAVHPEERRAAVLKVIRSARRRLRLSPVRCDDGRVLEAIHEACRRGVRVEAVLTRRERGRASAKLLRLLLEAQGVRVWRYDGPYAHYHAKYAVADERTALIGSLNFTRRCFKKTCDFLVVTEDPGVVAGLTRLFDADCGKATADLTSALSPRLIVSPEWARGQLRTLIEGARSTIRLIDPKLSDPGMLDILRAKAASGVAVSVSRHSSVADLVPHGKLLVVDGHVGVIGSMALSPSNLDTRREVAILVSDRGLVRQLARCFPDVRREHAIEARERSAVPAA